MTVSRLRLILAVPAGVFLFLVLMIALVPDSALEGVVSRGLAREGYTFRAASFGKTIPVGISASGVSIGSTAGEIIRLDSLHLRLRLLPLLMGKPVIICRATAGGGKLQGEYHLSGQRQLKMVIERVSLADIPFFATITGAKVSGELTSRATFSGTGRTMTGELKLEVRGAEVSGVKIAELPLPDAAYRTVQGSLRAMGGKLLLESFSLEGEGLYARLKGEMPLINPLAAAPLNLTLELMPKPEFLERQKLVFLLLVKYLVSPGHYQLPVRGTLGKPVVS